MSPTRPRKRPRKSDLDGFIVRPIRSDEEYEVAVAAMDALAIKPEGSLSRDDQDRLELLTLVVGDYDDRHFRIAGRGKSPVELLRYLMEQNDLKPIDIAPLLGGRPAASLILSGKRELSKAQICAVSQRFKIDPGALLRMPSARRAKARPARRRVA